MQTISRTEKCRCVSCRSHLLCQTKMFSNDERKHSAKPQEIAVNTVKTVDVAKENSGEYSFVCVLLS
jgi:hypothetical protein